MDILKSKIRDIKYGDNFKIVEPVNLYECTFGNNVFIGPFVEITKGVKVGMMELCKALLHSQVA